MKNRIGTILMVIGAALILGALGLFLYNEKEADSAEKAAAEVMEQLLDMTADQASAGEEAQVEIPNMPAAMTEVREMTEVVINGYAYIGYLSIPYLGLELPVMADWDYDRLQIAPCRFQGTTDGDDLVIMAHNYVKHFGQLSSLAAGDTVAFTDMDGVTTVYEVVALDVLLPTAVEEMTSGDYDLTLFTCTYGGKSRVTVYCDRAA